MSSVSYHLIEGSDLPETITAYQQVMAFPVFIPPSTFIYEYYYDIYNTIYGNGGNDTLGTDLETSSVTLYGGADNDKVFGGAGYDLLVGDDFNKATGVASGSGIDLVKGGDGHDRIYGAGGGDELLGENGNDLIYGGSGNDRLVGGSGLDVLVVGLGRDTLFGGLESDTFVIQRDRSNDVIRDFTAGGVDHDFLDLSAFAGIRDFRDLVRNHAENERGDVVLDLGGSTELVLADTKLKQLIDDDFKFAI